MQALFTIQSREAASGSYHVITDDGAHSLCGAVNADSPFAADVYRVLSPEKAERQGCEVCGRCATITDS